MVSNCGFWFLLVRVVVVSMVSVMLRWFIDIGGGGRSTNSGGYDGGNGDGRGSGAVVVVMVVGWNGIGAGMVL